MIKATEKGEKKFRKQSQEWGVWVTYISHSDFDERLDDNNSGNLVGKFFSTLEEEEEDCKNIDISSLNPHI